MKSNYYYHKPYIRHRRRAKKPSAIIMASKALASVSLLIAIFAVAFVFVPKNSSITYAASNTTEEIQLAKVEPIKVDTIIVQQQKTNSKSTNQFQSKAEQQAGLDSMKSLTNKRKYQKRYVMNSLGSSTITLDNNILVNYDLPSSKYVNMDFSSFQPFMDYKKVTNESTPAYAVCHSENAYTDENGLRRMRLSKDDFRIDGQDDYIVALGTFYKTKGTAGQRYLVVTSTGMFTITAGDEKSDNDTDQYNMVTTHAISSSMIEWIVDTKVLNKDVLRTGDVTEAPVKAIQGEIQYIYEITNS